MSFALENCERKDGNYNILELLKYNFYLPFFYFGPIMTFDKFYIQVSSNIPCLDSAAQAWLARVNWMALDRDFVCSGGFVTCVGVLPPVGQ